MNEITRERTAELCEKYITENIENEGELLNLEFTELSMLYKNAEKTMESVPLKNLFESKLEAFKNAVVQKLKGIDKIYVLHFNPNKMPIVDYSGAVHIFTDIELCKLGVKNFLGKNIKTEPEETAILEISSPDMFYNVLWFRGIRTLRINEGIIALSLSDLTELPAGEDETVNPDLQNIIIFYLQYALTKCSYENKQKDLSALAGKLIYEICRGKYIVPAKKAENGGLLIPQLCRNDESVWTPVFTDRFEFTKMYSEKEFNAAITDFDGIVDIYRKHGTSGIVVNPKGANLVMNDKLVSAAEKAKAHK